MKWNFGRWLPSRKWLVVPPILVGVVVVGLFAQSRKELPRLEVPEQAMRLSVIEVGFSDVTPSVKGFGTAVPSRRWEAIAEIKGRIVELHPALESGNVVQAGDLLVRIDDSDYRLQLSQREADLAAAKAQLVELETGFEAEQETLEVVQEQLQLAHREHGRAAKLKLNRAISDSEADQIRSSLLGTDQSVKNLKKVILQYPSRIAAAKAAVSLATARVHEAERDIGRTTILSPFRGVIAGADLEVGQFVNSNQSLFEIQNDQVVEIAAQFTMAQLARVSMDDRGLVTDNIEFSVTAPGAKAGILSGRLSTQLTAKVISRSGDLVQTWEGRPVRITEAIDRQSRTLGVVIEVDNFDLNDTSDAQIEERPALLRFGTFCEVILEGTLLSDSIMVPRTAIDGDCVYLVDEKSRLMAREIVRGIAIGEDVTVESGLQPGELVAAVAPVPAIEGRLIEYDRDSPDPVAKNEHNQMRHAALNQNPQSL